MGQFFQNHFRKQRICLLNPNKDQAIIKKMKTADGLTERLTDGLTDCLAGQEKGFCCSVRTLQVPTDRPFSL